MTAHTNHGHADKPRRDPDAKIVTLVGVTSVVVVIVVVIVLHGLFYFFQQREREIKDTRWSPADSQPSQTERLGLAEFGVISAEQRTVRIPIEYAGMLVGEDIADQIEHDRGEQPEHHDPHDDPDHH